jgi:hypothetical protein
MVTVVDSPRSPPAVGYLVEEDQVCGASSVVRSVVELADASAAYFTRASGERDGQEEYCRRCPICERDHGQHVLQRSLHTPTLERLSLSFWDTIRKAARTIYSDDVH